MARRGDTLGGDAAARSTAGRRRHGPSRDLRTGTPWRRRRRPSPWWSRYGTGPRRSSSVSRRSATPVRWWWSMTAPDDPAAVAEVCRRHGATVIHRSVNGGPGAARNEAVPAVTTELVAFVDSDCRVHPEWLDALTLDVRRPSAGGGGPAGPAPVRRHLGRDPSVLAGTRPAGSALDMGPESGEVGRAGRSATCPRPPWWPGSARWPAASTSASGSARTSTWCGACAEAGWRVRYEPSVTVHHDEPTSWTRLLARRFRYGTSAGPLARRHPGRLAPLELRPWPTAVTTAMVAGHPVIAIALLAGSTGATARPLRRYGVPLSTALWWSVQGVAWTVVGLGRAADRAGGSGRRDRGPPKPAAGDGGGPPGDGAATGRVVAPTARPRSGAVDGGRRGRRRGLRGRGLGGGRASTLPRAPPPGAPTPPDRRVRPPGTPMTGTSIPGLPWPSTVVRVSVTTVGSRAVTPRGRPGIFAGHTLIWSSQ